MAKQPFTGLDKLLQTVAFSDSIQEAIDPKLLPNGRLSKVRNAVFDKLGVIRKRKGYEKLSPTVLGGLSIYPTTPPMGTLTRAFSHDDELLVFDEQFAWARTSLGNWVLKSAHGAPSISRVGIYRDVGCVIQDMDCEVATNGILCAAYTVSTDASEMFLFSAILDLNTGGTVYLHKPIDQTVSNWSRVRTILVGTTFVVIARDGTAPQFKAMRLASASPSAAWTAPAALETDQQVPHFDAVSMGATLWCLAYYAGDAVKLKIFDLTDTEIASATTGSHSPTVEPHGIALDWDGEFIHLAYYSSDIATVKYEKFNAALVSQGGATVKTTAVFAGTADARIGVKADTTTGRAIVLWQETFTSGAPTLETVLLLWRGVNTGSYALMGSEQHMTHHLLVSRPWIQDGEFHALTSGDGHYQSLPAHPTLAVSDGLFCLRWNIGLLASSEGTSARLVAQAGLGEAFGMNTSEAVRQVAVYGDDRFTAQKLATDDFDTQNQNKFQFEVFKIEPRRDERLSFAQAGAETVLSGGLPSIYDGELLTELAFPYPPLIVRTDAVSPPAGGLENGGVYIWKVVFEWIDKQGNTVWSETSLEVSATAGADNQGRMIYYRGMPCSNKGDWYPSAYLNMRAVIYRTLKNDSEVFYKVGSQQLNRFATDYYGFLDSKSDADIEDEEQIYTTGGELDAQGMPSCSVLAVVDQRAWLRSDEFPRRVWPSKFWIPSRIAEFNRDFQSIDFPVPIYALETANGTTVAFGADSAFMVEGRGPGANGQNNDWLIREIAGEGTTQPMSVISIPVGIMFHNGRAFRILAGSKVEAVGEDAETTLRLYPRVTGREMSLEENTVRFLCYSEAGDAFVIATYNWLRNAWSFHYPALYQDVSSGLLQPKALIRVAQENYLLAGQNAFIESGYSDLQVTSPPFPAEPAVAAAFYSMLLETADIKVESLSEFRRIWHLITVFSRVGAHGLHIDVSYDKGVSWVLLKEFSEGQVTACGILERLRVHFVKQKCSCVRLRFYDVAPAAGGGSAGFEAHGFTLEFGMKRGILKVPAMRTG